MYIKLLGGMTLMYHHVDVIVQISLRCSDIHIPPPHPQFGVSSFI